MASIAPTLETHFLTWDPGSDSGFASRPLSFDVTSLITASRTLAGRDQRGAVWLKGQADE